jgi:hypothetical protein
MGVEKYKKEHPVSTQQSIEHDRKILILECARKIRAYADQQRKAQRNELWCIHKDRIRVELGEHSALTDEVIEFMEEKGWAVKANYPPECWRIN